MLRDAPVPGLIVEIHKCLAILAEERGLTRRALDGYADCVRLAREWNLPELRVVAARCRMALLLASSGAAGEAVDQARAAWTCTAASEAAENRLLALVTMACLGEAPVESAARSLAEQEHRAGVPVRLQLEHLLWRAGGDARHAAAAARLLARLCEHAPGEDRQRMTETVHIYRAVREACDSQGPPRRPFVGA